MNETCDWDKISLKFVILRLKKSSLSLSHERKHATQRLDLYKKKLCLAPLKLMFLLDGKKCRPDIITRYDSTILVIF